LKKKKLLAGTEDMPWSGTDYLSWGNVVLKTMGTGMGMGMNLHPTEEQTLSQLGWKRIGNSKVGYSYENGNQKMMFHPSGFTEYWSNKEGQPTESWIEIEMPIRWLWKNKGSVTSSEAHRIKPYSAVINTLEAYGHKWHEGAVQFAHEDNPLDTIIFMSNGEIYHYNGAGKLFKYKNVHDLLHALDLGKGSAQKPNATGEMPWYDNQYVNTNADNTPIKLSPSDEGTMESIGFSVQMVPSNIGNALYYYQNKTGHRFYFRTNGESEYADPSNNSQKFSTVKDAMQFAWNKFSVFIEESFFKDLVEVLMTRPDAAKMLM